MLVAFAVDVGPRLDQPPDDIEAAVLRSPMERGRTIERIKRCDIEAMPEEHVDAIEVPLASFLGSSSGNDEICTRRSGLALSSIHREPVALAAMEH